VQVTLKLQPGLPSLRSPALKACVEQAIDAGHERFGMRLLRHSLEKDGLALFIVAPNRRALSRGIQGISVRIARAVNRKLERKGRLFADRYEAQSTQAVSTRAAPNSRVAQGKITRKKTSRVITSAKRTAAAPKSPARAKPSRAAPTRSKPRATARA
jgi:hypothetical protein